MKQVSIVTRATITHDNKVPTIRTNKLSLLYVYIYIYINYIRLG